MTAVATSPRRHGFATAFALTSLQLRLLRREPMVTIGMVGFPAATVVVLAGVFGKLPDPDFGGIAPSDHYFAGYIGVVLAAMGVLTIPVHIATQRELGFLRRFQASGLSAPVVVASEIALGAVLGVMAVAAIIVLGVALYGLRAPARPLDVLGWGAAGLFCFVALGGALGTLVSSGRAATAVGNLLFVPMFLLGGGGPPRAVMTAPMRAVSDVLPLTHLVGGLRQSWLGTTDDPHVLWWPLLVAASAVVVALVVAVRRD